MRKTILGKTGLEVSKNAFGALPIQRLSKAEAVALVKKAYEAGINFFDTAHAYSDSEEKLGEAFLGIRQNVVIATKTAATNAKGVRADVEMSLARLKTDYIDIIQFHNPAFVPNEDSDGYQELLKLQKEGKIRHIGITQHRLQKAVEAVESGLYETIQFPLSCLSSDEEFDMVRLAQKRGVGVICMKAMCGGLLTSAAPSMSVLDQFEGCVPIYGVQREEELNEIVALDKDPPKLDEKMKAYIAKEREELAGEFCRGCGYCVPTCPAGIEINNAARMTLLLNRSPWQGHVSEKGRALMQKIEDCIHCGACTAHCPYHLNTPALLERNYAYYKEFLKEKGIV